MSKPLAIYLRNHEAAGRAGRDLFHRALDNQRRAPYAADLRLLSTEVEEDLESLNELMRAARVHPDPLQRLAMEVAERLARLKPNGHLLTRAPLSDLIEVEGLLNAVHAKSCGWEALLAAGVNVANAPDLNVLLDRARSQIDRLRTIHGQVAAAVLSGGRRPSA